MFALARKSLVLALAAAIWALPAQAVYPGEKGKAPWSRDNVYYPVEITAIQGDRCMMHWLIPWQHGEYDEWGSCSSFVPTSAVQVLYNGSWYAASVIGYGRNCHRIHYDGYPDTWNECVGQNRIRW